MKRWTLLPFLLLTLHVGAQFDVPVPLQLVGADPDQRQVTGLGFPVDNSAGVSLEVARSRALLTGISSGQSVLSIELEPALTQLAAGMELTLIPGQVHDAAPSVLVNGAGPFDLVNSGGLPLDSAELPVGIPTRMVFDGTRFRLITGSSRPCAAGYRASTHTLCIQDSSFAAVNFRAAANGCASLGGKLCSINEWVVSCHRLPGFIGSVVELEWVDHASNSQTQGKLVGVDRVTQAIGCDFGDTDDLSSLHRYRCCTNR
jgi:hypothetical protein